MPKENLTRIEASERAQIISTHNYKVILDLTNNDTFKSVSTVTFSANQGSTTFIDLIAEKVEQIELNGTQLPLDSYQDSRIPLPNLQEENTLTVSAICQYSHTGEGLHRAIDPADGEAYLYSQFEVPDSRRMYAVFEQPDLKANFTFEVTAPKHWKVFSVSPSPEPVATADGKYNIWNFSPTEKISSYLTCIVAGPYAGYTSSYTSVDGREIPMGVYARNSLVEYLDGEEIIKITKQGMPFFEKAFKQPYPFRKYDQIFVPEYNAGAMEHPGCVTILDDYIFRSRASEAVIERRAVTVLHELAHMWFGDLVTMKWWDDLWLNESFAEFMSHVATAETTRWKDAWVTFNASEKSWAQAQDQLPSTHPIAADIRDLEDVIVNFDGITYGKGAAVFQQLVAYVSWDGFITGVQRYLAKKAWGNATLADLLTELEIASGRDLKEWSELWLEEAGINTLRPEINTENGKINQFRILQECDRYASLRPHRLKVGGYDLIDGKFVKVIDTELDIAGKYTDVPAFIGKKRPDLILLNDGDLAYAKIRLDEQSLACAIENINAFTDLLTRTLVLFSAWDMCRDGQMRARDYARLILRALEIETHGTVLRTILSQLETAGKLYSAPESRSELELEIARKLSELTKKAEAGSDRQLQLTRAAISFAPTSELATYQGWLAGKEVPAGLNMDNAMRWTVIQKLAEAGLVTEEDIENEKITRDNTASGANEAASALGALSSAEAKIKAWEKIIAGNIPNSVQRAMSHGFTAGDVQLLLPYVDKYFAVVESQWKDRTHEIASNTISGTFPLPLAGRTDLGVDLVTAGQKWLTTHSTAAPALLRLVSEELARAERAVKAQECDRN